jgi:hypothetical protein
MEGVAGISRPPPTALSRERAKVRSRPFLPVENAPLRRKGLRAVKSPSFTARFFGPIWLRQLALHETVGCAIFLETRFI